MKTITATDQQYFYHPDHLGSSSFITDASGDAHQHSLCRSMFCPLVQGFTRSRNGNKTKIGMQYLPYGEDFISQRIDWQTRYTLSAKEKDKNTGYHYFGARYYNSDISVWLSVDPLADKYPSTSPYAYCYNNPMNFRDLWGLEGVITPKGKEVEAGTGYKQTDDKKFLYGEGLQTKVWDPDKEVGAHGGIKGGYVDYEGDPIEHKQTEHEKTMSNPVVQAVHQSQHNFIQSKPTKIALEVLFFVSTGGVEGLFQLGKLGTNLIRKQALKQGKRRAVGAAKKGFSKKGKFFRGGSKKGRDPFLNTKPKEFRNWFHRKYKDPGAPNVSKSEIEAAFKEWVQQGRPNVK